MSETLLEECKYISPARARVGVSQVCFGSILLKSRNSIAAGIGKNDDAMFDLI